MPSKLLVDFTDVKRRYPILEIARYLGLELKEEGTRHRGVCPYCEDKRGFAVTPEGGKDGLGMSGCFKCGNSKDSIGLVMHFKGIANPREAALLIVETFGGKSIVNNTVKNTVPSSNVQPAEPVDTKSDDKADKMAKIRARLLFEHELIQGLMHLSPEVAQERGIGFIRSGVLANRVLIPIYRNGVHEDYIGINPALEPPIKLPAHLTQAPATNVVRLVTKAG